MMHSRTFAAIPPGETIKEQLQYRGMSQKEFAIRAELSEKHVSNLLKGDVHLTPNVAMRLEMVLGIPAHFWQNLESLYRENLLKVTTENQMDADMEISKKIPYSEMVNFGWIPPSDNSHDKIIQLRKFFEVSNLSLLENPMINRIACRRLAFTDKSDYALITLAQKAKIAARTLETRPININGLKALIPKIRALTTLPSKKFCPDLVSMLSDKGVALILLPNISGSFLHGVSFYDGKKIVVGLTARGKYADIFWFSLFHELAHIIYGHIGQPNGTTEIEEKIADEFARDTLISPNEFQKFTSAGIYTRKTLIQFAELINIDVSILIGRLQNENIIKYSQFNSLKKKYSIS